MDIFIKLLQLYSRLEIYGCGHFLTIDYRADYLAAHLETDRAFNTSVSEIEVSEFPLDLIVTDIDGKFYILETVHIEKLSKI